MKPYPYSKRFDKILKKVQAGWRPSTLDRVSLTHSCKHGVHLCECSDDCADCYEEALELFAAAIRAEVTR